MANLPPQGVEQDNIFVLVVMEWDQQPKCYTCSWSTCPSTKAMYINKIGLNRIGKATWFLSMKSTFYVNKERELMWQDIPKSIFLELTFHLMYIRSNYLVPFVEKSCSEMKKRICIYYKDGQRGNKPSLKVLLASYWLWITCSI